MRILYFHQHFSTPRGSTGIRSYEMAKKLVSAGHEVTMVCGSYSGGETGLTVAFKRGVRCGVVDGFNVIEFELEYSNSQTFIQRSKAFMSFAIRSIKIAFTEKYDLLFATTTPLTAAIPGIVVRWFRRKPFVFEVRDLWPELPREMGVIKNRIVLGAMGVLEWLAYKNASALIGLSPGIEHGIKRFGKSKERVTMIPNGCDLHIFSSEVSSWQPEGVTGKDLMAVFTGAHGIANGLQIVIETAKELQLLKRQDIKLVLVGQGKLKPQLIEVAEKLHLDNIIFQDPVNKSRLAQLFNRADIGLQLLANVPAFYYGTSPNKFFDYISAGLPVLNNYPGWLADMITSSQCGIVVPPDNPSAFATALIDLADNREQLPVMALAARNLAQRKFDRNDLASDFVDWLEQWGNASC